MDHRQAADAETALIEAIKLASGNTALARLLGGISPQAVSQWKVVPSRRVLDVERITGVPRQRLRPDLYPREQARA